MSFRSFYRHGAWFTRLCHFGRFSAETSLGQLVALSLLRELGPSGNRIAVARRAGSALTAEIGLMKATEQLSVWNDGG